MITNHDKMHTLVTVFTLYAQVDFKIEMERNY